MPKRECPFNDHLLPQLKVHVGQKQVSNGVNKEQEMSKVYEKTLNFLKNGSRELEQKLSICKEDKQKMIAGQKHQESKPSNFKQMIFDNKLKLCPIQNECDLTEQETCPACATWAVAAFTRCFYCNNFKCPDCLEQCTKCEEDFCNKCSLIVYEGGDHTECLACYR